MPMLPGVLSRLVGEGGDDEQPETGLLSKLLPASASPFGGLLEKGQLDAMRRHALLTFGAKMLESQAPHPQGTGDSFMSALGKSVEGTDWPGILERGGQAALNIGQLQYKLGNMQSIQKIIQQHGAKPDDKGNVSTKEQLRGFQDVTAALANAGTPEALDAMGKVASAGKLFKESAPSQHSMSWEPVVVGGQKYKEAHDPITGEAIMRDGKPWRLPEGAATPGITEAQSDASEQRINEQFLQRIDKHQGLEDQFKAYESLPTPMGRDARMVRVKQAQILAGAASAQGATDPRLEGILGILATKVGLLKDKTDIDPADMMEIDQMVKQAHEQNRQSGHRLWKAFNDTALDQGYISPTLKAYESEWGDNGKPAASPGDASKVDRAIGGK
jgi:hypothetical protein